MREAVDRTPRSLHPWTIAGRLLTCTRCGAHIDLIELPAPWIDAARYVCPDHLVPLRIAGQFGTSGFPTTNEAPKSARGERHLRVVA